MSRSRYSIPMFLALAFALTALAVGSASASDSKPFRVSDMLGVPQAAIQPHAAPQASPRAVPEVAAPSSSPRLEGNLSRGGLIPDRGVATPTVNAWDLTTEARRSALPTVKVQLPPGSGPFGVGTAPSAGEPRFGTAAVPHTMLYVVADVDDPAFRAAISSYTGGAVDYFAGNVGTPSAATLSGYTCVFVHPNSSFADPILLGDRLADFVDIGGKVILGIACAFDAGAGSLLQGRIMTPGYSPVGPSPTLDYTADAYAGDGTTDYFAGVLALDCVPQDGAILQPPGVADGSYAGGEIMLAYRPDGAVVYVNGTGHVSFGSGGDWAKIVANACWLGGPDAGSILYASANSGDDFVFRSDVAAIAGSVVDYFPADTATPSPALLATYDCVFTHSGSSYFDPIGFGNNLAAYVDGGRKVILGVGTALPGHNLAGGIMTPAYSPVFNPVAALHPGADDYLGDGTAPLYAGVAAYNCDFREFLSVQGAGKANAHYEDGEIASAHRPDGKVIFLNGPGGYGFGTGDLARLVYNACAADLSSGHKMLYAPSWSDDPALRGAIAAQTGGVVDYFDATAATPSLALLSTYDCVFTWSAASYSDLTLFGDRLADYVDAGGKVVLGQFCTYTLGAPLGGRIMTPGYCPVVSPSGNTTGSATAYSGDGTTCLHHRVLAYTPVYEDDLVLQGDGIIDSKFVDGTIAAAYRPDRRVVYLNGAGGSYATGTGDWPILIANACECEIGPGFLYGSSPFTTAELFNLDLITGKAWTIGPTEGNTEVEYDPATGRTWIQQGTGVYEISLANGSTIAGPIANGAIFNSMEAALGRVWAGWVNSTCVPADFGTLDPATGVSSAVATGAWPLNISGLAFDFATSTMYGVSGCGDMGPSDLFSIDVTNGTATLIANTGVRLGSLQFGPDGDLYGGGDHADGANLYRINPTTGAVSLIGPTGQWAVTGLTLVPDNAVAADPTLGGELSLAAPFPNPSQSRTVRLDFTLPKAGSASLEMYDVAGRRVWSKDMSSLPAGQHSVEWNGLTTSGRRVASGVYFVRLRTDVGTKRVTLVRLQ